MNESPLRILRKAQNKTLADVAKGIDLDPGNLSRIERCEQQASPAIAEKLTAFFKNKINEVKILYPERFMKKRINKVAA